MFSRYVIDVKKVWHLKLPFLGNQRHQLGTGDSVVLFTVLVVHHQHQHRHCHIARGHWKTLLCVWFPRIELRNVCGVVISTERFWNECTRFPKDKFLTHFLFPRLTCSLKLCYFSTFFFFRVERLRNLVTFSLFSGRRWTDCNILHNWPLFKDFCIYLLILKR